MSWQRYQYYDFFPRSVPRKAKGGIKAQSKRGSSGESWWARSSRDLIEALVNGDFAVTFRYPGESADRESALDARRRCRLFRRAARDALGLET